ncbi:MAG: hypothetical protein FD143_3138 [Ignavibacteria bacterium]|nr:MAG: hypothetical protein FD143_3138 [Ignavibacteria bacterium]KAF0154231.1 MAG: hypothetical protein FD188_3282 [Ignavibacteria bacterium]
MKNLVLFLLSFLLCSKLPLQAEGIKFADHFFIKDSVFISFNSSNITAHDIVKLFKDGSLCICTRKNNTIFVFDKNSNVTNTYNLPLNIYIDDLFIDEGHNLYVLDGKSKRFYIMNNNGIINSFPILQATYFTIYNELIYTYNTFYYDNMRSNSSILNVYTLKGNLLRSFGDLYPNTKIGLLPIATGNINRYKDQLVISHSSSYITKVFDKDGNYIQSYSRSPSFFYKPHSITSLNQEQMSNWSNTTLLHYSSIVNDKMLFSFYSKVDNSKQWFVIQDDSSFSEIEIPSFLTFIGLLDNKLYCINDDFSNTKQIKIEIYEFPKSN